MSLRQEEIIVIMALAIFCVIIVYPYPNSVFDDKYVPNVLTGLTTIAGLLTAFVGFWLVHIYSTFDDKSRKFLFSRMFYMVATLFFGLMFIILALSSMVYGNLRGAYTISLFGTALVIFVAFDVLLLMYNRRYEEEAPNLKIGS